ncbi:MAG: hypothetical protein WC136_07425 [Sphaerochaeta sp.]
MNNRMKPGCMLVFLLVLATMVFVSCDLGGYDTTVGSLKVSAHDDINKKTIEPDLDMNVASYRISGARVGSSDQIGPVDVTSGTFTFSGIRIGDWMITVEAYNDDPTPVKIGEGLSMVTIYGGSKTEALVSIVPIEGEGDFSYTIDWTGNTIGDCQIEAFLTPEGASTEAAIAPEDITISGSVCTITVEDLETGYYDFSFILKDGELPFGGCFHEVRILDDQTSSGSESIPVSPFGMSVSFINNLHNPFDVTISSDDYVMEGIGVQSFTVSPADAVEYQWYLDGMKITGANETTYQVDSEAIGLGWHTLSVKVKKADDWYSSSAVAFFVRAGLIELTFINKDNALDTWNFIMDNGPAENSGFEIMLGTSTRYGIPTNLETIMEKSYQVMESGSFMVASTVPLAIDETLFMFPKNGSESDEHKLAYMGAWGVDSENVELDHAYDECMFSAISVDAQGRRRTFDAIGNFSNRKNEDGTLRWGPWDALYESVGEGVSITFTRYGMDQGSYVMGTISGTVVSVIPNAADHTLDTLGHYTVSGSFITTRAMSNPSGTSE